jgi:hypothetical protein
VTPRPALQHQASNACLLNGFQKLERLQQASSSHDVLRRRLVHNAEVPQRLVNKHEYKDRGVLTPLFSKKERVVLAVPLCENSNNIFFTRARFRQLS